MKDDLKVTGLSNQKNGAATYRDREDRDGIGCRGQIRSLGDKPDKM